MILHKINNHFLCVRELWVRGHAHHVNLVDRFCKRPSFIICKCKRPDKIYVVRMMKIYQIIDFIPHIFYFNAFLMLANRIEAKIGSITAQFEHFSDWKRLAENEPGASDGNQSKHLQQS